MVLHRRTDKYIWTSYVETSNQIGHILIGKRRHLIVIDVQFLDDLVVILTIICWLQI